MRPLNALALQRDFASQLTRVGLPVTPPIYQRIVTKLEKIENRTVVSEESNQDHQVRLVLTKDTGSEDHCVLTVPFLQKIRLLLSERAAKLRADGTDVSVAAAGEIESALGNGTTWQKLLRPFKFGPGKVYKPCNELLIIQEKGFSGTIDSVKTVARVIVDYENTSL